MQVSAGPGDTQGTLLQGQGQDGSCCWNLRGRRQQRKTTRWNLKANFRSLKELQETGWEKKKKGKRNTTNILELENLLNLSHASESLPSLICGKKCLLQVNPVFGSAWRGLLQPCTPQRTAAPLKGSQKERLGWLRHSQTSLNSPSLSEQKPQKFSQGGHGRYHGFSIRCEGIKGNACLPLTRLWKPPHWASSLCSAIGMLPCLRGQDQFLCKHVHPKICLQRGKWVTTEGACSLYTSSLSGSLSDLHLLFPSNQDVHWSLSLGHHLLFPLWLLKC